MAELKLYSHKSVEKKISLRAGESKLGQKINFISEISNLKKSEAEFVLFGIPEDIGVRANHGKAGAATAWEACLSAFLNVQENSFFDPESVLLLGEIDCSKEMKKAENIDISDPNYFEKLGELVEKIDAAVSGTMKMIISAGKVPVIIGGGHNNAFGNIKGASEATKNPINVLNIDVHTDLRKIDHRHSGNGFSYARKKKILKKYSIFGLQQNYTPQYIFEEMDASEEIEYVLFEDLLNSDKSIAFKKALSFVSSEEFGLEIDCDSIANFPSSAVSPSGFTLDEIRNLVRIAAQNHNLLYLHLCEAIASEHFATGKALTFLISDFIKGKTKLQIIPFDSKYSKDFADLNKAWLEKYFYVEPHDEEVLSSPERYIIAPGGKIFFAKAEDRIVGTVALMKVSDGVYELTKMAVSPEYQGRKIGQKLLEYSIDFAKTQKWQELLLYSNRKLVNAIYLYRKYGFEEVPVEKANPYERADIKMTLKIY